MSQRSLFEQPKPEPSAFSGANPFGYTPRGSTMAMLREPKPWHLAAAELWLAEDYDRIQADEQAGVPAKWLERDKETWRKALKMYEWMWAKCYGQRADPAADLPR